MVSMDEIDPEVFYKIGQTMISDSDEIDNNEEIITKDNITELMEYEILDKERKNLILNYRVINKSNKLTKKKIDYYISKLKNQKSNINTNNCNNKFYLHNVINQEISIYNNNCKNLNSILEKINDIENKIKIAFLL